MNKKAVKFIITSLAVMCCISFVPKTSIASTHNNLENPSILVHKDKSKGFDIFNEDNYKYLSPEQKKELKELKKCKDKGETLTEEQQKTIHVIIDCIIKGKLGDQKYSDFNNLMEKKKSRAELTEDEKSRLKEYNDTIDGTKPTSAEIFDQFLR